MATPCPLISPPCYLEESVVTAHTELASRLHVVVNLPEVFNGVHSGEIVLVLLPTPGFIIAEVPEGPNVIQWVFHLSNDSGNSKRNVVLDGSVLSPRSKVPLPFKYQS